MSGAIVACALRPADPQAEFAIAICRAFLHRACAEAGAGSGTGRLAIVVAGAFRVRRAPLRTLKTVGFRPGGEHGFAIGRSPRGMRNARVSSKRMIGSVQRTRAAVSPLEVVAGSGPETSAMGTRTVIAWRLLRTSGMGDEPALPGLRPSRGTRCVVRRRRGPVRAEVGAVRSRASSWPRRPSRCIRNGGGGRKKCRRHIFRNQRSHARSGRA